MTHHIPESFPRVEWDPVIIMADAMPPRDPNDDDDDDDDDEDDAAEQEPAVVREPDEDE
jgi:hypothetical protein